MAVDVLPNQRPESKRQRTSSMAALASIAVFLITVAFAGWTAYLTGESMVWYREQAGRIIASSSDPEMAALVLTVYTGFVKKQMALAIAGMLALLGLGLSLNALRNASTANAETPGVLRLSFSSVSPGVCAFMAATVIVVVVVTTRDSFGVPPIDAPPPPASSVK